jgi:hypothetical protein
MPNLYVWIWDEEKHCKHKYLPVVSGLIFWGRIYLTLILLTRGVVVK